MTDVDLEAVVDEQIMRLREVFNLKVGSQIMLGASPSSLIQLKCGGVPMYKGRMGRKGNQIAIRIEERFGKTVQG